MRAWVIGMAALAAVGGASGAWAQAPAPTQTAQPANWKIYAHPELGFSIESPAEPATKSEAYPSPMGPIPTNVFYIDEGGGWGILLTVGDYSRYKITVDPQKGLDRLAEGAAADLNGVLLSKTPITVDGFPGREIVARADPAGIIIKGRIIYAGQRVYQLMAVGPAASGVPADFERVETSLKLMKP